MAPAQRAHVVAHPLQGPEDWAVPPAALRAVGRGRGGPPVRQGAGRGDAPLVPVRAPHVTRDGRDDQSVAGLLGQGDVGVPEEGTRRDGGARHRHGKLIRGLPAPAGGVLVFHGCRAKAVRRSGAGGGGSLRNTAAYLCVRSRAKGGNRPLVQDSSFRPSRFCPPHWPPNLFVTLWPPSGKAHVCALWQPRLKRALSLPNPPTPRPSPTCSKGRCRVVWCIGWTDVLGNASPGRRCIYWRLRVPRLIL